MTTPVRRDSRLARPSWGRQLIRAICKLHQNRRRVGWTCRRKEVICDTDGFAGGSKPGPEQEDNEHQARRDQVWSHKTTPWSGFVEKLPSPSEATMSMSLAL